MEELDALKTFERAQFLKPPPTPRYEEPVDRAAAEEDLAALQRLFPRVDPLSIKAVYRGFAGNYETSFEMLSLALAEEREGSH